MPEIATNKIGVALDMRGCPNRCRHCYLGFGDNRSMTESDLRWTTSQFRDFIKRSGLRWSLNVATSFREPDYADEYRRFYALETEFSHEKPERYELLSVWRLAHDREYASWAKTIGPRTCQITLFGLEATNDWFYRRQGAFKDALAATERLLENGMLPRWQILLTAKTIPELGGLLRLIEHMKIRERVEALGADFHYFLNLPGPLQEARKIEYLRPTLEDTASIPAEFIQASRLHLKRETLWQTEGDLYREIMAGVQSATPNENLLDEPGRFWFFVTNTWDVFSNAGTLEPWWKLGNLKTEKADVIVQRFLNDAIPGLDVLLHHPPKDLAAAYGDLAGGKIYTGREDLLDLYRARYCEDNWKQNGF